MQRACGAVWVALLCAASAISILISCLYDKGTNKVWGQKTVAQNESFTFTTTRMNTVHKQHSFLLQKISVICWKSVRWGMFPKKAKHSNREVRFQNWMLRPPAYLIKLPPSNLWGLKLPSFWSLPLHHSFYCASVSWCCIQGSSETAVWRPLGKFTCMFCTALLWLSVAPFFDPVPPSLYPKRSDKQDTVVPSLTARQIHWAGFFSPSLLSSKPSKVYSLPIPLEGSILFQISFEIKKACPMPISKLWRNGSKLGNSYFQSTHIITRNGGSKTLRHHIKKVSWH